MNKSLLKDHSAEMGVIGSCLISPRMLSVLKAMGITSDKFHHPAHAILWDAIAALEEVDLVTVCSWLRRHGKLQDVGGEDYVIQVAEEVPSAANGEYFGRIVLETARRRSLMANLRRTVAAVGEEPNMAAVFSLANAIQADALPDVPRSYNFRNLTILPAGKGLSTGFPNLDKTVSTRGHPQGQVTVVAAPAKGGKTTLMLDMFLHDLREGRRVCYATFADIDAVGIKKRLIRKLCGHENPPEDLLSAPEYQEAEAWLDAQETGCIYDGFANGDDSVEAFAAWLEAEHRQRPFTKCYVDYAQELRSSSKAAQYSPEQNQAECARVLVRLARKLDIAVIVGSQVTEAPKEGAKAKTKWSRSWEEKAGWVLVITKYDDLGPYLQVAYSRFGPQSSPKHTVGQQMDWLGKELAFVPRG